jgi:hypothetical protein
VWEVEHDTTSSWASTRTYFRKSCSRPARTYKTLTECNGSAVARSDEMF